MTTTRPTTIELETRSAREVVDITARVGALLGGAPDGSFRCRAAGSPSASSRGSCRAGRGAAEGEPSDYK